jgi:S-adenosylmethionine:tRNA ribosyltransferase-isomerase
VGAGTFKPVECSEIESHTMHYEWYSIPDESKKAIESDSKILAVGTTVTRSIESYIRSKKNEAKSNIFLNPVNTPKRVDYLLTNFHLPKSTLIMLVAGFIGIEETLRVYEEAIKEEYRFFSYGDSMLII